MNEILERWLKRCEYDYSTQLTFETEDINSEFWEVLIGEDKITPCLFDSFRIDIQGFLNKQSQYINHRINNVIDFASITYQLKNKESIKEMRRIIDEENLNEKRTYESI